MRDPRIHPVDGDIVRNQHGLEFHVRETYDHFTVAYQEYGTGELLRCDLSEWRQWAASDTVIKVAGVEPDSPDLLVGGCDVD